MVLPSRKKKLKKRRNKKDSEQISRKKLKDHFEAQFCPFCTFTEEILNGKLHFLCSVKALLQRYQRLIMLIIDY